MAGLAQRGIDVELPSDRNSGQMRRAVGVRGKALAETEADWQELFEAYRYQVILAGFGPWDEAAFANDTPDETESWRSADVFGLSGDRGGAISARFERYANDFVMMLVGLERETVERLSGELGERVRTRDGTPVTTVIVRFGGSDSEVLGDKYSYDGLVQTFVELNETLFAPDGPEPERTPIYA